MTIKLTRAEVTNFRSIEGTGAFGIEELTCLVGKNEAGKTAVLQALQGLRPYGQAQTDYDVTKEYPRRHVTKFDQRHPDGTALVVRTWWELDDESAELLTDEFGAEALTSRAFTVDKFYKNKGTTWGMPIDEGRVIASLFDQEKLSAAERKPLQSAVTASHLAKAIEALDEPTVKQTALLTKLKAYRDGSIQKAAIDLISSRVPEFFYVSHYDRMSGQVATTKLAKDKATDTVATGDRIFLDLLELAGTSLEELEATTHYEDLKARCEAASNDITEQIFKYWTQNDALEVNLDFSQGKPEDPAPFNSGTVVRARVWNTLHRASVPFSERSAGFVWFFSFLVQFAAMRKEAGNVVILLDEPGLTLHGKAQADLLEYVRQELLPHHQVIFSTHSPFMVPADDFASVRVVEDVIDRTRPGRPEVKGTKVREDVLVTNPDTLFPLQGALGYDIVQSLFVGKNTLLVEGPSDILYLQALSGALVARQRKGLDPRWTACPSGGIDKIRPFVSLFGGNHLNIAVLTDLGSGDKKKVEDLRRSEILKSGHFFTAADFTGKPEADIEDLFAPSLFARLLTEAYSLSGTHVIDADRLEKADPTTRQVKKAEAVFRLFPADVPDFDHFTPSAWLIRNPQFLDGDTPEITETLQRAETCFAALNGLL